MTPEDQAREAAKAYFRNHTGEYKLSQIRLGAHHTFAVVTWPDDPKWYLFHGLDLPNPVTSIDQLLDGRAVMAGGTDLEECKHNILFGLMMKGVSGQAVEGIDDVYDQLIEHHKRELKQASAEAAGLSQEAPEAVEQPPLSSAEVAAKDSVDIAEEASSELAKELGITEEEDQLALLFLFLTWNSYVILDWAASHYSPANPTGEEMKKMKDSFAQLPQEWIPHQVDLLIKDGRVEPDLRDTAIKALRENCKNSLWMRLLPESRSDDPHSNIIGRLVLSVSKELKLTEEASQRVHAKLLKTMETIQAGLAGLFGTSDVAGSERARM